MARYTGPRSKVNRRFGQPIYGPSKALERRPFPPGVHGSKGGRRKQSDYAIALGEKQKLKHMYGVLERQFRRYFEIAHRKRGVTGEMLLQILEARLDNVVFRLGLATSRRLARQMVNHGHVQVNGRKVTVASYACKEGDAVDIKDNPKSRRMASRCLEASQLAPVPAWITLQKEQFRGTVDRMPTRDEIAPIVNERLVVELFSR